MIDPFFNYFKDERFSISQDVYKGTGESSTCKEYKRFPRISLLPPQKLNTIISNVLEKRKSSKSFLNQSLTLSDMSSLLFWSMGTRKELLESGIEQRMHPSGGAKFPIECYPLILQAGEIRKGIYHYNACGHVLEKIAHGEILDADAVKHYFYYPFASSAAVILLFSFIKERSMPKYGSLAYKLGLLEAGHIGQNVYLVATALNFGCRSLGIQWEKPLYELLDLDGSNESLCYAIAVGNPEK